ncbi:S8 family serine peptidase [Candidatus Gracilibacteria bacterium]|nr:S8 family serine peptidase [Candidatus Gracilibacteria bacterium]
MKKGILVLFLFGLFGSFVGAVSLSNNFLEVGKTVSIYGDRFGDDIGTYGGICFNDDTHCFVKGSNGIISWSNNLIQISIPSNIPLLGLIKIYVNGNLFESVQYSVKPIIVDISDGKYIKKDGAVGEKVLIQGLGLGDYAANVYFGSSKANIISRSQDKIWLYLPSVNEITSNFRIENNAGINSDLKSFKIYPKLSNDTYSSKQKYLSQINVKYAWNNYPKLGEGITVAVLDAGVKIDHPDLKSNIWTNSKEIADNGIDDDNNGYIDDVNGWNFVGGNNNISPTSDHGTMIAGIISAIKDNGLGIAGIAPKSKIMPIKIFDDSGKNIYNIGDAVRYAVDNGAQIINMSFGAEGENVYQSDFDNYFEYAWDKGAIISAAAGNAFDNKSKQNLDRYPSSPVCNDAGENYVIGVASVDENKKKSEFSYYGKNCLDMSAPGEEIFSLSEKKYSSIDDIYDLGNGTSFASPIVAGAIALLWANKPELKNIDIQKALFASSEDIDSINPGYEGKVGKFLNIEKLMKYNISQSDEKINPDLNKKAVALFNAIKIQMRSYSQSKRTKTYQSLVSLLSGLEKKPEQEKNLELIQDLKYLFEGELNN